MAAVSADMFEFSLSAMIAQVSRLAWHSLTAP
jgi:hypothetical protein